MHDDSWRETATKQVRILQIIVGRTRSWRRVFPDDRVDPQSAGQPRPGDVDRGAAILAGMMLITYPVVLRSLIATARRQILAGTFRASDSWNRMVLGDSGAAGLGDGQCLLSLFQRKTIVGAAMIEGCAFFAAIVYLLEGGFVSLGLALVLLAGLAAHFPTVMSSLNRNEVEN